MPNKVFEEAGLIHNVYEGEQTADTVIEVQHRTEDLIAKLRAQGRSALILVDLRKLTGTHSSARLGSSDNLKKFDFDRIALFGANLFIKYLANFIIKASGNGRRVRYFNSETEARAWLAAFKGAKVG